MKVTVVPAVLLVLVYAAMSGFVPPVIRASLMGILAVIGVLLERGRTALNLLGAAVAGMLLWNPYFLFDISFQLSVCASAGILLFYEPLRHALARLGKIPPRICEGCALSTAAQVLVLPIILYNFHSFPLYFIPANQIVVPLLEWVIIGGLLAALSSFLFCLWQEESCSLPITSSGRRCG
jgi:competence protein ComEC